MNFFRYLSLLTIVLVIHLMHEYQVTAKPNPADPITEEKMIQEINSIYFNETGNFTVKTPSSSSFGESDFYSLVSNAQDFMSHQINSAEKSINDLEIRARKSFNLTGIILNRLIIDTDVALHEFRMQIEREFKSSKMRSCLESNSDKRVVKLIQDARIQTRECARVANSEMYKHFTKIFMNMVEIGIKMSQLKRIKIVCLSEPGIGEKLNCFLDKIVKVGQILEKIISIFRASISSTAENFALNIKKASMCMTHFSQEAIKDVNELITVSRECAQSNSIEIKLDERANNKGDVDYDDKVSENTSVELLY